MTGTVNGSHGDVLAGSGADVHSAPNELSTCCQGGPEFSLSPPVTIEHNLIIRHSKFDLLDVSNDSIGHSLVVENNVATATTNVVCGGPL